MEVRPALRRPHSFVRLPAYQLSCTPKLTPWAQKLDSLNWNAGRAGPTSVPGPKAVGNCVVVTVERLELGSQRYARRTCQRRTIQQEIGPLAVGLCQCIAEHESPIRIRVADLDCLSTAGAHDVEGAIRVSGNRILDRRRIALYETRNLEAL